VSFGRDEVVGSRWEIRNNEKKTFYLSLIILVSILVLLVFYVPSKVNLVSGKQAIETSQKEGNLIASPVLFNDSIALQALNNGDFFHPQGSKNRDNDIIPPIMSLL
jgi:hypothetical protein